MSEAFAIEHDGVTLAIRGHRVGVYVGLRRAGGTAIILTPAEAIAAAIALVAAVEQQLNPASNEEARHAARL